MKKITYILLALGLFAFVSCNKDANNDFGQNKVEPSSAPSSFIVSSPETKTTLDGLHVHWASGDEIRVYGHNTSTGTYSDNALYELTSGEGSGTGTFTLKDGETGLSGTYDAYYAIYPGSLTATVTSETMTLPRLNSSPHHLRAQDPSAGQCDPHLAIMTAKFDGSRLVFRHGVAYIKLTIPDDGVTKVDINFTNNCLADTPTYNSETGALSSVGSSAKNVTSVEGTFTKGATYYFAAIPRAGYAPSTTTITLTGGDTYSTTHFTAALEVGKVYNLGMPQKNPAVTASDVNIESDATAGTIVFTVKNVKGGSVTSEVLTGATIANLSLGAVSFNTSTGEGSVSFTCDANTDTENAKTATVRLTYTYDTDKTATKDVTITQQKVGASAKETHTWDFATYTDDEMKSITGLEADAKATAGQTWEFGDGLTMVTNSSSKWNKQTISSVDYKWVATGGKYGSSQKYFQFTTAHTGTVTVLYASGGSGSRALTVKDTSEHTDTANVSSSTSDLKTVTFTSVAAGTVMLYSKDDNVRIFSISFVEE